MNLKGRDFLTLKDFSTDEINYLVDLGLDFPEILDPYPRFL